MVEDNADLREYIASKLAGEYRIIESENGTMGLQKAIEALPDLIVSDYMMPDLDGLQLCAALKKDERTSHIPIILLTALAAAENKLSGLQHGADDYLTKPFDARELTIRIGNLINNRQMMRERFGKRVFVEATGIAVTSAEEKFLQRMIKIVEENIGDSEFGPEQFCREAGLSRMQLHRKLTALTGQSTTDFVRTIRLKRARQLMEGRAGNVSEIAYEVGFNTVSYFTKCFREQYQITPQEFFSSQPVVS